MNLFHLRFLILSFWVGLFFLCFLRVLFIFQGTTMVFRLLCEDQKDRWGWLFQPGREVDLCYPAVDAGGHGVHDQYHLLAHCLTRLDPTDGVFPPFPYKIVSSLRIAVGKETPSGLFGTFCLLILLHAYFWGHLEHKMMSLYFCLRCCWICQSVCPCHKQKGGS